MAQPGLQGWQFTSPEERFSFAEFGGHDTVSVRRVIVGEQVPVWISPLSINSHRNQSLRAPELDSLFDPTGSSDTGRAYERLQTWHQVVFSQLGYRVQRVRRVERTEKYQTNRSLPHAFVGSVTNQEVK